MSLAVAILAVAAATSPLPPLARAEPTPAPCRPAPYHVASRVQDPPSITRLIALEPTDRPGARAKPAPCYLTHGGRPAGRSGGMAA